MAEPPDQRPAPPSTPRRAKRWAFGVLMFTFLVVFIEIGSYAVIYVSRPYLDGEIRTTRSIYREQTDQLRRLLEPDSLRRDRFDPELGWHYRRGYIGTNERITEAGLRGDRDYETAPPDSVLRIAAFGDSFVFGMEVGYQHSWAWQLEQSDTRLEVLNYGVGGYGTDQAFLRYRAEGITYSPDIVLIGFAPVNLGRNVNRYRRFLSTREAPWVKPRFLLTPSAELELLPAPVQSLDEWRRYLDNPERVRTFGTNDQWYEPLIYENALYDWLATMRLVSNVYLRLRDRYFGADRMLDGNVFRSEAPAFQVTIALLERFAEQVRTAGAHPILVMLPDRRSVVASRNGGRTVYEPLVQALSDNHEIWDMVAPFVKMPDTASVPEWFMPAGHYSPSANKLIADEMAAHLRNRHIEAR